MKLYRVQLLLLVVAGLLTIFVASRVGAGTTGTASGIVKDTASGAPLAGANIIVDGTTLSTVTDDAGKFVITNIPPGDYTIEAQMVGYADQKTDGVVITMDMVSQVDFDLSQKAIKEETVVVTRPKPMIETSNANTLNLITAQQEPFTRTNTANLHTIPGMLSAMPGVIEEADGSGQMYFRGGRYDQAGWYVEGMPLIDPNSGMFGTNLYTTGVSKLQMYTGGFGSEYGNAITGVLNEVIKTGANAPGFNTTYEGGSDAYRTTFVEYGAGTAETFNYYAATSLLQSDLTASTVKNLEYADSVVKLVWPSKNNSITLLGMQGSQVGLLEQSHTQGVRGEAIPQAKDYMRSRYAVLSMNWNHTFNPRSFIMVQPYYQFTTSVVSAMGGSFYSMPMGQDAWSVRSGLQAKFVNNISDSHSLKIGGSILKGNNNSYSNYLDFNYDSDTPTFQTDLYAEDQMKLSDKLTFTPGVKYESINYDRKGNAYIASAGYSGASINDVTESRFTPRAGIAYAADERSVWKANWGKYTKFVPANAVQITYPDPDAAPYGSEYGTLEQMMPGLGSTDPQQSTNMELSYEKQVSNSLAWRLTHFRNDFSNLSDYSMVSGASVYTNLGQGSSKGLELYVRKKMSDNCQGWFSYTYQTAKSNRSDLNEPTAWVYTPWDQRHTFALVTEFKRGDWSHSLRIDSGSGRMGRTRVFTDMLRAQPYALVTYNLSLKLPEQSRIGDTAYLSIFNIFNSGETLQFNNMGGGQTRSQWMGSRSISMGLSKAY